jgi:hypothetical protein
LKHWREPDGVVHTCNLSTQEPQAEGSEVQVYLGLYGETLSKRRKKERKKTLKRRSFRHFEFKMLLAHVDRGPQ